MSGRALEGGSAAAPPPPHHAGRDGGTGERTASAAAGREEGRRRECGVDLTSRREGGGEAGRARLVPMYLRQSPDLYIGVDVSCSRGMADVPSCSRGMADVPTWSAYLLRHLARRIGIF